MRRLVPLYVALASLTLPLAIYSQTCDPLDPFCVEDEALVEDDIILEDDNYYDWSDNVDQDYVYTGQEGPISPENPPSIIDSGTYSTQISISTEYLEDHGVHQVTIH